jgi:hypothetical protein
MWVAKHKDNVSANLALEVGELLDIECPGESPTKLFAQTGVRV